ncbi:MAG: hypothetical protein DRK00_11425, partial [Thermoprotei archaeon]
RVPGTRSRFRRSVRELVRQQVGWGKGYAHVIARYRREPSFWRCYRLSPIIYRLLGSLAWLYPIMASLLAPLKGLYLAVKLGNPHLLPYWTVRRWAFLYGILTELRRAFKAQGTRRR